ncbi:hypothetical protein AB685_29465, partial [Bacillus sp. LL01]|uniref:hypothetical protein n=1 Tax=Bacillus sp. LL01 TaxID=1665556 RepID=UPI00064CECA8
AIKDLEKVISDHAKMGDTMVYIQNTPFHKYGSILVRIPRESVELIEGHFDANGFETVITTDETGRLTSFYISWGLPHEEE